MKEEGKRKFLQVGATIVVLAIIIGGVYLLSQNDAKKTKNEDTKDEAITLSIQEGDWVKGPREAKVVIIEYSDFECPACAFTAEALKNLQDKYPNDVAIIHRHFPLSYHEAAFEAAVATEIAGENGLFWEMYYKIFENQDTLNHEKILQIAEELGLNRSNLEASLDSDTYKDKIYADQLEGQDLKIDHTPTLYVNGKEYKGNLAEASIEQEIRQYL